MKKVQYLTMAAMLGLFCAGGTMAADDLAKGFIHPPESARPWVYWFWNNGNITRGGITADLEAMKRTGIGGVLIMEVDVSNSAPKGPVDFASPQWRKLFKFMLSEADRLGIEVNMNNDAGWTGSGGPWITPDVAQKKLVWTLTRMQGPKKFKGILPQPEMIANWYRDISVLAFPTPAGGDVTMATFEPKVTASVEGFIPAKSMEGDPNTHVVPKVTASIEDRTFVPAKLMDGDPNTHVVLPLPTTNKPQYVQFEFSQAYPARTLELVLSGTRHRKWQVVLQVSDNGRDFRTIRKFGARPPRMEISFDEVSARWFRILFTKSDPRLYELEIGEVELTPRFHIENIQGKASFWPEQVPLRAEYPSLPPKLTISSDRVMDLTTQLGKNGSFVWDVPAGKWTVLRIGYTPNGTKNHPAPQSGRGLECDKLSKTGAEAMFTGLIGKLIADSRQLVPQTLVATHIDSWEVGSQNWTENFRAEFERLRGYDPLRFLPVITGRVVDGLEISERFLWDLRQTISDLLLENYAGHFRELASKHGMRLSIEAYGGPFDCMACAGRTDEPMCEFWSWPRRSLSICRVMSSAAHVYGKRIVGAEAFTAYATEKWQGHPANMKDLGDWAFCEGVNRIVFHRYAMQPWANRSPGMSMGPFGVHYERTQTWWEQSVAWHEYLARCQFLLQRGLFVADICCLQPEDSPMRFRLPAGLNQYSFDACPPEVVLTRVTVKNGRLVLPDGMSYRLLVLPNVPTMTPRLLRKIKELVEKGATVVGARPVKSPSLSDYPKCDEEVKKLTDELWGNCDGKSVTERCLGKGRIFCGKTPAEVLGGVGVRPDFTVANKTQSLRYIHRVIGDTDVYFVANKTQRPQEAVCEFRGTGKRPELWWPDTGRIERFTVYDEGAGCVRIPIRFDPVGSVFVVFRRDNKQQDPVVSVTHNGQPLLSTLPIRPKVVVQKAVYGVLDDPSRTRNVRAKVQAIVESGEFSFRVARMAEGDDPAVGVVKTVIVEYTADGQAYTVSGTDPEVFSLEFDAPVVQQMVALGRDDDGKLFVEARQPGRYELKTASGRMHQVEVGAIPEPLAIGGPWELRFTPGWGAPETATLNKLISWSEHRDPGVKYFSGTATYLKTINVPAEMVAADRRLYLDLGKVEVMAKVKLNGKDLGILWKPPYRLDVTDAVKFGSNALELQVVNLWPNRMIGDEQLPEDSARRPSGTLKEWPQWLLEGKPSPTGRFTFTTYRLWQKDQPLLKSGLLGPVMLQAAVRMNVK